ncbi:cubilin-like isoform X2 [Pomacea canaliculata]|uniref:cubilin-like isoform X2 n=1 Tax=Pomacea canaliculata TaxID=400727 RepID=UPI000D737229|nr:cubilin-like isoform X2 [Pomacea canaliculata]
MALTMLAFGVVTLLIVHSPTLAQTTRSSDATPTSTTTATSVCPVNATTLDVVPGQVGHVTSPNYPSPYYNYANCRWLINAGSGYVVKVTILNFNLETCCDYLELYNGTEPSSSSLIIRTSSMPQQSVFHSSGQYMYIRFSSDGSVTSSGFRLTYEAVDQQTVPTSVCTSNGTTFSAVPGQVGYLTSLYYPSVYSGFISCSWTINSTSGYVVKATILNVTNPEFYFYIRIYDGMSESSTNLAQFSSILSQTVYYSSGQSMYIRLTTDGLSPNTSFSLTYEAVDESSGPKSVCTSNGTTLSAVPGQVGYLTSPYYPSVYYTGFISCSWTINSTSGYVVKATVLNANPQFYSYIVIYDGTSESSRTLASFSSMPSQTVYYSSGQSMCITLTTYGLSPNASFSLTYEAVEQLSAPTSVCTSNGTTFSAVPGQVGYLPSLYWPSVYSGFISCSWTINSTTGYVVRATLLNVTNSEFNYYIVIYDGISESSRTLGRISSMPSQTVYYSFGQSMYITLSTNRLSPNASFSLTYEAVEQLSAPTSVCTFNGTTFSAVPGQVGYLTSLYWPSVYSGFISCSWTINSTSGYVVKATLLNVTNAEFYLNIVIYDVMSESSRALAQFSSMSSRTVYYSSGRSMYITLTTDGLSPNSVFSLTYEAVEQLSVPTSACTSNGTTLSAVPGQVGHLTSLYYPSVYSGFIFCSWTINSTTGYVVKATLLNVTNAEFYFYIGIYDGMSESSRTLASFSNIPSQTVYYSSGQSMYITLTTYGLSPNSFFSLTYEAVDELSAPTSVCTSNGTNFSAVPGQVGYLPSLYFPSVYFGSISCSWTIISTSGYVVKATILPATDSDFDFNIVIYDGMSASSPTLASFSRIPSQTVYYSSGQSMYIRITTYGLSPNSVFYLTYEAVDPLSAKLSVCSVNAPTIYVVPGQVGYLTSPNYPSSYYKHADCRWLIDASSGYVVKVTVLNVSLEPGGDYLELYNGSQISSSPLIIRISSMPSQTVFYSSGQYLYIRFYRHHSITSSGFRLTYEAVDQETVSTSVCPVNGTALSALPGRVDYLRFPNHRSSYSNNTNCRWLINATIGDTVKVTVLNASSDFFYYIQIFDGMSESSPTLVTFYGMPLQTVYYSSGQYMYIRYTGYGSVTNSGLRVTYEALNQQSVPTWGPTTTSTVPRASGSTTTSTTPKASDTYSCTCSCVSTCSRP